MAYFKIEQPNQAPKWIKSIDRANGTLEFSTERTKDCFQQDSGFFADSEADYLRFHFTEAYPELQYMTIDTSYGTSYGGNWDITWNNAQGAPQEVVEAEAH